MREMCFSSWKDREDVCCGSQGVGNQEDSADSDFYKEYADLIEQCRGKYGKKVGGA